MSSSSALTHGECVNGMLVLVAAATTFVGYASSVYWERTVAPRLLLHRELTLEQEIAELEAEAADICTTSNLHDHSRLTRRALRLRQELLAERRKRLAYECSVTRALSLLLAGVSFAARFCRQTRSAAAPGRVSKVTARNESGALSGSSYTTVTSSPIQSHDVKHTSTAPRWLQVVMANALNIVRYNATTVVKYLLRFGGALVLLCAFGNLRGLMAAPPSFEEILRYCVAEVIAPLLFSASMYVPTVFAPDRRLSPLNSHGNRAAYSAVGAIGRSVGDAAPSASLASSVAAGASFGRGAEAAATFQRAGIHFCVNNHLTSWLLMCYLASYLIVRVFG
ncbi:hypothetical protein, conserved [Leishmania lindenbergi]|uniref:Uncharacterized protein n=1 Tax=Leishmania lindenbergi TaxID=651832 RepID=A0AAW3B185_9TRYP